MVVFFILLPPLDIYSTQYIYTNKIRVPFYSIPTGNETKRNETQQKLTGILLTNWHLIIHESIQQQQKTTWAHERVNFKPKYIYFNVRLDSRVKKKNRKKKRKKVNKN